MGAKSSRSGSRGAASGNRLSLSTKEVTDTLLHVPILTSLPLDKLKELQRALKRRRYPRGRVIVRQGDQPDGFYIIESGKCEVSISSRVVSTLTLGDYFGERGLIADHPRSATVSAAENTVCLYLSVSQFRRIFDESFIELAFPKRNAVCGVATNDLVTITYKPRKSELKKTAAQAKRILAALSQNALFGEYDEEQLRRMVDAMYAKRIGKGESPVRQGETGDHVYVVEKGLFEVRSRSDSKKGERVVGSVGPGTVFGELALLYNASRNATVTATADSQVWILDRFTFRRIILNTSAEKMDQYQRFLKKVELLRSLSSVEREKVAEALDEVEFAEGQAIVRQGERGDCMFFVKEGVADAQREGETDVVTYRTGEYFGELALLEESAKNVRQASVTARTNCVLLKLSRIAVSLLLGPVDDLMKRRMRSYSSMSTASTGTHGGGSVVDVGSIAASVSSSDGKGTGTMQLSNFRIIGRLGRGAFGLVRLVEHRSQPGQTYALKAVSKVKVVKSKQQSHILNEKRILMRMRHPFVTRLHGTFQDRDSLYFVLEPCLGGELFTILRTQTSFDEDTSKFYAATVVQIFEHLQDRSVVYRDLKPENLLLDSKGFLKLTDFGFAKEITKQTYTLCGTPDYLAPEIVLGKGHGKSVDWWTLGVLIYEMIAGYPPFYSNKPMKTYAKILHARVKYPTHFSIEAADIVKRFLNRKPSERLGVIHGGAALIRRQAWFNGFDFKALMTQKMVPPIRPKVKDPTDIRNFRAGRKKDPEPPRYQGSNKWCAEFGTLTV